MAPNATIDTAALLAALSAVKPAVGRLSPANHVLIKFSWGQITVTACDFDHSIEVPAQAETGGDATVLVSHERLDRFARFAAKGSAVTLVADAVGAEITVRSGRSHAKLPLLDPGSFPQLEAEGTDVATFTIPAPDWRAVADFCRSAVSTEDSKFYLTGVHIQRVAGEPAMAVATNGHCLAATPLPIPAGPDFRASLPLRAFTRFADGDLSVRLGDRLVEVRSGEAVLVSKLIEGAFPPWEKAVSGQRVADPATFDVDADPFAKLVRGAMSAADAETIGLELGDGILAIRCRDPKATTDVESSMAVEATGAATWGANAAYLAEAAEALIERHGADAVIHVELGHGGSALMTVGGPGGAMRLAMAIRAGFWLPGRAMAGPALEEAA